MRRRRTQTGGKGAGRGSQGPSRRAAPRNYLRFVGGGGGSGANYGPGSHHGGSSNAGSESAGYHYPGVPKHPAPTRTPVTSPPPSEAATSPAGHYAGAAHEYHTAQRAIEQTVPTYTKTLSNAQLLTRVHDLLTPGPTAREIAQAAHILGVRPSSTLPSEISEAGGAGSVVDRLTKATEKIGLPKVEVPHTVLGRETVGTPSLKALIKAAGEVPRFTSEGPAQYRAAYQHNKAFAKPGPYQTKLTPEEEQRFRHWVQANNVPFNPNAKHSDYDMRGYWKATGGKGWKQGEHFPDTFKTPLDTSFSSESKYANKKNPFVWKGNVLVDKRTGRPVFDESGGKGLRAGPKGKLTTRPERHALRAVAEARADLAKSRGGGGNSVEAQIGRELLKSGLNRKAAAGIIGNAYAESSLNPGAEGYGGGGLWGFTAHPNSLSDLQAYAASQGKNWQDPTVQTQFLLQHVSPETIRAVNAAPDARSAAAIFMEQFERPGIPRQDVREGAAAKAFAGAWSKPNPKAVARFAAAKFQAKRLGLPVPSSDVSAGGGKTVLVRADAKGMVDWAKSNLGTQEGSAKQLRWNQLAEISSSEPWCAAFIGAGLERRGVTPPSPDYNAADYLNWSGGTNIGTDLSKAKPGDLVVFGASEHIGLYVGSGRIVAGNWSNEVAEYAASEDKRGIEGIVRPHYKGGKVRIAAGTPLPDYQGGGQIGTAPAVAGATGAAGATGSTGAGGRTARPFVSTRGSASSPLLAIQSLAPTALTGALPEPEGEGGVVDAILKRHGL